MFGIGVIELAITGLLLAGVVTFFAMPAKREP